MNNFWEGKKIGITGSRGFVGSNLIKNLLQKRGVSMDQIKPITSETHDLRDFERAKDAIKDTDVIFHLAADVGGIGYSDIHPATQMRNCLLMDLHMFEAAAEAKVKKFVAISSSIAYPADASSPLVEKDLFSGFPTKSSYGYGFAKRDTVVLAKAYRQEKGLNAAVLIPNNAYGPGEKVDLENGHVIPSLIYKCLNNKELVVWGNGEIVRDYLYIEDFVEGVALAAEKLETSEPVNLGSGVGTSIKELVNHIVKLTGFEGEVTYDSSKPAGPKERVVDMQKGHTLLGFAPTYTIRDGLIKTIDWIQRQQDQKNMG